jgi:hypothetical protein
MSPQQALEQACQVTQSATRANLLVMADGRANSGPVLQFLNIDPGLSQHFLSIARSVLPADPGEVVLRPYDACYKPDPHEVCYLSLDTAPRVRDTVASISEIDNAEPFSEDDAVVSRLRAYAVVLQQAPGSCATFLRSYSEKQTLTHGSRLGAVLSHGVYRRVESRVFLFDKEIDCYSWGGYLFLRSVHRFHLLFRYMDELRSKAASTVDLVVNRVPISNLGDFRAACTGQFQMMAKVASISRKPYLQTVTMDDIKRTIEEFGLDVALETDGDVQKLVFDPSPKKRWLLLKLLDDDYLGSVMTRQRYEVNSKSPVSSASS